MAKDRDQRTEQQTAKRKKENRKKGQVAKSPTLVGWISLLVATFVLPKVISNMGDVLAEGVRGISDIAASPEPATLLSLAKTISFSALTALAPVLLAAMLVALVGNLAQVGLVMATDPIKPKFERVNPVAGFKRLFSAKAAWEAGKQIVTMGVIAAVAIPAVMGTTERLLGSTYELSPALSQLGGSLVGLVRTVAMIGTVIGVADYLWARFNLVRDQRMTKEEVKREHRESEGDPHLKAKLRSTRMAMSQNRMLSSVADANVVITNPTHYAVALRYEPTKGAPRVVARGSDAMAAKIRTAATEAGVPMISSPPLARALHRACRVDEEIPAALFQAVATVLAFVHRVGRERLAGNALSLPVPDTWTPPGEDPEESLTWDPASRREAKRAARVAKSAQVSARAAATSRAGAATGAPGTRRTARPEKVPPSRSPLGSELTRTAAQRLAEQQRERATAGAGRASAR